MTTPTNKIATTAAPIMPVLAERWSPRPFDANHKLSQHEILSGLEAARWSESANNAQPWRFAVITRDDAKHAEISATLSGWNQSWAPAASAIILVAVQKLTADGSPYVGARYDAGLAVSKLVIQAQELGLHTHQMAGLDAAKAAEVLGLSGDYELIVSLAIGKVAAADLLAEPLHGREIAPRTRLELDEIVFYGKP
jgi:nitroreductase